MKRCRKKKGMPVRTTMCASCPYREGSPTEFLKLTLLENQLNPQSGHTTICHSTGNNPTIKAVNVPEKLCRGARDFQIKLFHSIGFIDAPTEEAWNAKRRELGV